MAKLKDEVNSGIQIGAVPGFVPEYHVIQACTAAGYQYYHNWQDLTWQKKAMLVAIYFTKLLVERHAQDAVNREIERRSRRNKARSRRGK